MRLFKYLLLSLILSIPLNAFAGGFPFVFNTDQAAFTITGPYDLRERSSYIQITNVRNEPITIHVQIFQHDRNCDELNFNDTLTVNDTVIYDLDNIIKNDGTAVPINLLDDSNGYIAISVDDGGDSIALMGVPPLIGNFRIADNAGYEYRSNMVGINGGLTNNLSANFNTVDNANQADVIGYAIQFEGAPAPFRSATVLNYDPGLDFSIFVYDMVEEPLSCDTRNFACGNVMNYGINEDYPNSRSGPLLCPGGGLADPNGGFISFGFNLPFIPVPPLPMFNFVNFYGFIGINNGNGTGSMDSWYGNRIDIG